jgi:hypothetical protein
MMNRPYDEDDLEERGVRRLPQLTLWQARVGTAGAGVALLAASFAWVLLVPDGEQRGLELLAAGLLLTAAVTLGLAGVLAADEPLWLGVAWGLAFVLVATGGALTAVDETDPAPVSAASGADADAASVISAPVAVQVWFLQDVPPEATQGGCQVDHVDRAYAVGGSWSAPWLRFLQSGDPQVSGAAGPGGSHRKGCRADAPDSWLWRAPEGAVFIAPLS